MKRFFTVLFFIVASSASILFADYNRFNVPDSTQIRQKLVETWFTEPLEMLRKRNPEIHESETGQRFQVRCEETETVFSIFVSPEVEVPIDVYTDKDVKTVVKKDYPNDIRGSWVLVRSKTDGKPIRIRYYFSADSDVYIQVSPFDKVTLADMVIFSNYSARGVQLGLSFENFYTASFQQVYSWTKLVLPWNYTEIYPDMYHSTHQMISVIRENLPNIVFVEDAMYNEAGVPVFVSTGKNRKIEEENRGKLSLSGAGFVKWIVDGLIYPLTGSYTYRDPLLNPTVVYKTTGFQGILDSTHDLSFSLNWTRNLAAASLSVNKKRTYLYADSGVDVSIEPFSAELIAGKIVNSSAYIKDTGYQTEKIKAILYVLAVSEPSYCYLAAIRSRAQTSPEVRPFNYCSVLFPYFDSNGRFNCAVFENGVEISLSDFMQRYKDDFVHLVRVETEDQYFPQTAE